MSEDTSKLRSHGGMASNMASTMSISCDVESPAQYLLSLYSQFYTLSDQVFTSNAGYLSRVLGDLGLNRYLICWVAFGDRF